MFNARSLLVPRHQSMVKVDPAEWQSIYIPLLSANLYFGFNDKPLATVETLTDLCENHLQLGKVERVDIATRPSGNAHVTCAFVHFSHWDQRSVYLRKKIVDDEKLCINTVGPFRFYDKAMGQTRFITLKVNKTPIEKVDPLAAEQMNIHQLIDNYKRLEAKNSELENKLKEATVRLEEQQKANEYNEKLIGKCREVYEFHRYESQFNETWEEWKQCVMGECSGCEYCEFNCDDMHNDEDNNRDASYAEYQDAIDCDCNPSCGYYGYTRCWENEKTRRIANELNPYDCLGDAENCAIFCIKGYCRLKL